MNPSSKQIDFSLKVKSIIESGQGQVVYFLSGENGIFEEDFIVFTGKYTASQAEVQAEVEMKEKLDVYVEHELEPIYGHERIGEIIQDSLESWKFQVLTRQEIEDLVAEEGYYLPS